MDTQVTIVTGEPVREVYLAPGTALPFHQENGTLSYSVPTWACHQMIVLQF
ncbi:hypothetical protein [Paenibacillus glucanolyticus]|uniref:hypothetical protein n=1 Tax=Paenibacillus glucanolyticus TaxID=59843 RepID=UPI000AF44212|nr:hypothetical protein [Paenibacillus glucanolyticus]